VKVLRWFLALFIALVAIGVWDRKPSNTSTAAGPTKTLTAPADPVREAAFQRAVTLARAVKASANDPASIEFFEAAYFLDGTVLLSYRGKNAFGAKIINHAILMPDGKVVNGSEQQIAATWNKYIANRSSTDLSSEIRGAASLGAF
jgi:hypothetical protein